MTPLTLVIPSESLPATSGVVRPWRMAAPTMAPTHWDTTYRTPLDVLENVDKCSKMSKKSDSETDMHEHFNIKHVFSTI